MGKHGDLSRPIEELEALNTRLNGHIQCGNSRKFNPEVLDTISAFYFPSLKHEYAFNDYKNRKSSSR